MDNYKLIDDSIDLALENTPTNIVYMINSIIRVCMGNRSSIINKIFEALIARNLLVGVMSKFTIRG